MSKLKEQDIHHLLVRSAGVHFSASVAAIVSIAATLVTLLIVLEVVLMTHDGFEREKQYQVMLYFANVLKDAGVVDHDDYQFIVELLQEKYKPIFIA